MWFEQNVKMLTVTNSKNSGNNNNNSYWSKKVKLCAVDKDKCNNNNLPDEWIKSVKSLTYLIE